MNEKTDVLKSHSEYKKLYKALKFKKTKSRFKTKIAILSSFTIKGLEEVLYVVCHQQGIKADIYLAPYNQYHQKILDTKSQLYKFDPDLVFLMIDSQSFLGDYWLNPYQYSTNRRKLFIKDKLNEIKNLASTIKQKTKAKIIIHNFTQPHFSPLGILENKQQFGFWESIKYINDNMKKLTINDPRLFIYDYNNFCFKKGAENIMDYKLYYLADMKLDFNFWQDLCEDYLSYIKPAVSQIKKCIVLDLDNTLWGGILGEEGISGIELGPTPEGRSYWEFQKYLLSLHQRGILLVINSRNNISEVMNVLRDHPYMVLKENHFSAIEANWDNKVDNMRSIASKLNIGMDSFVFFDDDPVNRDLIQTNLPEITVINMPEDKALYLDTLLNLNEFNTFQITNEDKNRGKMYYQERKRHELEKTTANIDEFVKSLKVDIEFEPVNEFNTPRISQLTQKTNQFNMTTKRYLEEDIKNFAKSDSHIVLALKVSDKFGDYGLTGVIIIFKQVNTWVIDTFLLSCRVLGRKVEQSVLTYLSKEAKQSNISKIIGKFTRTDKNTPAENFYRDNGFKLIEKVDEIESWEVNLK